MREELVTRNVAKLVRVSTPDYEVGNGLDPVTAKAFLAAIREERLFVLYLCAIVLGMRRGELLGLAWSAVDLDVWGGSTVRQTLTVINGRLSFERPKTRTSRRVVPLPAVVVNALRAHRERQEKDRANNECWTDSDLVFTTPHGRPIPPATLGKQWREIRKRVGLDHLRFHDLRHTAVSLLLALGVPPHIVREIAGHSDIKVTMTVYAHGSLDEHAAALAQLGAVIGGHFGAASEHE